MKPDLIQAETIIKYDVAIRPNGEATMRGTLTEPTDLLEGYPKWKANLTNTFNP
ncbi:MAG: hypothetical protein IPG58_16595 [Acidobacteria bacterium]|nr:hypothetical protein [Acidobacteriota bacterium]